MPAEDSAFRSCSDCSGSESATLSNRLRRLEARSLITREGAAGRLSVVDALGEPGQKVLPVIEAINDFAEDRRQSNLVPST